MGQLHPTARGKRTVHQDALQDGPTWNDIDDFDDLDQVGHAIDTAVRQSLLRTARLHVLRDAIAICYTQHSVNHQAKCRPLYIEYCRQLEVVNEIKINIPELHPPADQQQQHDDGKGKEGGKE